MILIPKIEKAGKVFWTIIGLAFLLLVGALDYVLVPHEVSVSLFYVLPIGLITWYAGERLGAAMAVASALIWFADDMLAGKSFAHPGIHAWNAGVRLFFFGLTVFSIRLGKALERERTVSRTDFLTGAFNSRHFFELAEGEMDRATRYGHPFTIAYLDLDNFKFLNDAWGHRTGDHVLQVTVSILKEHLRKTDIVARMGGDEFAVLLPELGPAGAQAVLSKVHKMLLQGMQEQNWPVTFSIGALTFIHTPSSVDEMIHMADTAMYEVKKTGKNSVKYSIFEG
jgi:diguanylate cyclase (GGDEF)-like protein